MEKTATNTDKRTKIYEVGYLIVPTVPEEHLAPEVEKIKSAIEKNEGTVITEDFPKLRQLAYTMRKATTGQNLRFEKAYFGWVKFEASPAAVSVIGNEVSKNPSILRQMVIETVRENTMSALRPMFTRPATEIEKSDKPKAPVEKMSEEEMEKTIENLVVE